MRGTFLVLKKELFEFSKDRKTMLFLAMPLILYPLLFGMMNHLGERDEAQRKASPSRIVLSDPSGALKESLVKDPQKFKLVDDAPQLSQAIADDQLDVKVEVAPHAADQLREGKPFDLTVQYDPSTRSSRLALERLQETLQNEKTHWIEGRFQALGGHAAMATPFVLTKQDISDVGRTFSKMLGISLPYILLISMYAASIQHGAYLSAGERERGTLMSLLATRLSRHDIILGKQLALFLLSILNAIIQLAGMAIGLGRLGLQEAAANASGAAGPAKAVSLGAIADPKTLLLTFLILIPLGLLFTAIVMLVGVQSKNTREAATALTPGIFLLVLLGVFTMAPGVEKMAALPWIPLVNVLVVIRKMFALQWAISDYLVALGMTIALAAAMTAMATKLLNRESALFKA